MWRAGSWMQKADRGAEGESWDKESGEGFENTGRIQGSPWKEKLANMTVYGGTNVQQCTMGKSSLRKGSLGSLGSHLPICKMGSASPVYCSECHWGDVQKSPVRAYRIMKAQRLMSNRTHRWNVISPHWLLSLKSLEEIIFKCFDLFGRKTPNKFEMLWYISVSAWELRVTDFIQ